MEQAQHEAAGMRMRVWDGADALALPVRCLEVRGGQWLRGVRSGRAGQA